MAYQNIIFAIPADLAEPLSDALTAAGALAVTMENAQSQPLFQLEPEHNPLWDKIKIIALFPESVVVKNIITQIREQLHLEIPLHYQIEKLADQDWVRLTQQQFSSQQYGDNLLICPEWETINNDICKQIVRIDPGLAFGTGTHPTTSLCLEWLAKHPPVEKIVIDYGCGSGILALSALALGATSVFAIDHDPQAIEATANNAELNTFAARDKLHILLPQQLRNIQADVLIANILAKPLIEMAENLISHISPQGVLVLSGILIDEINAVTTAYQPKLQLIDTATQEEWARIVLQAK